MSLLFCIRPATRNIGNDVINRATADLLYEVFGADTGIVNVPALQGPQFGGITAQQVYDMNRLADGVVIGGGNLFENGQLTLDLQALHALRVPLLLIGLSHGRIYEREAALIERSDSLAPEKIKALVLKADFAMVRDESTKSRLEDLAGVPVALGGCPTLFLPPSPPGFEHDGSILLSIRHPNRMSVAPNLQWRVAEDVRRLIAALRNDFGDKVYLICHDYADIEFASAFPEVPLIYFDNVEQYIDRLRRCRLNISYRLHAFLPCLAFGTPSTHVSYDERGKAMLAVVGMAGWDVDLQGSTNLIDAIMERARNPNRYHDLRQAAAGRIAVMRETTMTMLREFSASVASYHATQSRPHNV